ncbi:MAG: DNA polymerase III subunit delta' [Chloroflexi bacterium RBG_13_50_21]|nr:MAG: DNA polymerase III subunit delta' [Chloroflexi bacterium RBG_13_50_21]
MNWGMIGHEWAVNLLAEHIAQGRERHAYLITGPQGVGRRTLALRFAQGLNCLKPATPGQPCLKCSSCKRIGLMQHPDLTVVEAEHEGDVLRIDQVRELQHSLSLAPYEARYRVALILRFEEAHASAANAMLKTLEEPPAQVIVILTAKSAESLLPTIVSRCEIIRLRPLSLDETARGLATIHGVPQEQADRLAHISGGRPGYAVHLFEQPRLLEQRQAWLEDLVRLLACSRGERFAFAKDTVENKDDMRGELQVWLTFWRDTLIYAAGISNSITNPDYSMQIKQLADEIGLTRAQFYVNAIESTLDRIDRNVNARLALDVLLMDFPKINLIG